MTTVRSRCDYTAAGNKFKARGATTQDDVFFSLEMNLRTACALPELQVVILVPPELLAQASIAQVKATRHQYQLNHRFEPNRSSSITRATLTADRSLGPASRCPPREHRIPGRLARCRAFTQRRLRSQGQHRRRVRWRGGRPPLPVRSHSRPPGVWASSRIGHAPFLGARQHLIQLGDGCGGFVRAEN